MSQRERSVLVVLPTLGERTETLAESLQSARSQAGVHVRIVVVAPKSAIEARAIAERFGASVVDDPQRGLSAAVNAGIGALAGECYYAWLCDDDTLSQGGLAELCNLLEQSPAAAVAFGACDYIDAAGRRLGTSKAGDLATRLLSWGPDLVPQPAALTRVQHLEAAGKYDETLRFAMDLDMLLRLRRQGRFVSTRRVVASFRWHADSLTVANRSRSLAESEMVKHRYLSPRARRVAPVWDVPVRVATHVAARRVNARARRVAAAASRG